MNIFKSLHGHAASLSISSLYPCKRDQVAEISTDSIGEILVNIFEKGKIITVN